MDSVGLQHRVPGSVGSFVPASDKTGNGHTWRIGETQACWSLDAGQLLKWMTSDKPAGHCPLVLKCEVASDGKVKQRVFRGFKIKGPCEIGESTIDGAPGLPQKLVNCMATASEKATGGAQPNVAGWYVLDETFAFRYLGQEQPTARIDTVYGRRKDVDVYWYDIVERPKEKQKLVGSRKRQASTLERTGKKQAKRDDEEQGYDSNASSVTL